MAGIFRNVPVLDTGARGSTVTFVERGIGDVLIAWENEALLTLKEFGAGKFEIVAPSESILAEPPVAMVDAVVRQPAARAKSRRPISSILYTPAGQEIAAKNFYRPRDPQVAAKYADRFPKVEALHHRRGVRRLGQGAGSALRRRRRVRPALAQPAK